MDVRVELTGRIALRVDAVQVGEERLGGRRGRLLFALLVDARGHPVAAEEVSDVLWPGGRPSTWEPALREVVAKVRAFLAAAGLDGHEALVSAHGLYELTLPPGTRVDVEAVADDLDDADRALDDGRPQDAVALASAAAAVAVRPLLPGERSPWAEQRRLRLLSCLRRATEIRAEGEMRLGRWHVAVGVLEELCALEPFRETAHLALMRAHAGAGNRAEAIRVYDRCRRLLAAELGVNPSPPLEDAFVELLQDDGEHGRLRAAYGRPTASP